MHWLGRGLCVCGVVLGLASCAQNKKLPQGERLSILNEYSNTITSQVKNINNLPQAYINTSWPQGGINSQHIIGNISADTSLKEVWSQNFGKGINKRDIILSAPVIQNNRIFVMDAKGKVSAFNFENGTILWENMLTSKSGSFKDTKSRSSGLAVDNNTLYATTGFGGIYAMDVVTGSPKWRKTLEAPIRIAPTITPSMILVQSVDNKLYALDKMTGNELWRFGVAHEDTVIAGGASPAYDVSNNIVVAGFSNGEIVVLNANIGTPLWSHMLTSNKQVLSTTEINTIGAYPIIEEDTIYAVSNSDIMVALDIRTGDVIWKKEIGSMQNMLLAGDYLFAVSNKNILYAIDKITGDVVWSLDVQSHLSIEDAEGEVYASQPIMINGNIMLAFSNGLIFRIDARNGLIVAKTNLSTDISNGIIAAQKKVIAISDEADVIVFE